VNYKVQHIPISKDKRPGTKINPQYITIHSTANPKSTAQNERDWLLNQSNTRTASWHICVDEKQAIEAIPLDEIAWHAGTTAGNMTSIGIEICESGDRAKTIQNTVELVAQMLFERDWSVDRLRRHFDWSGKNCPRIMSANNWEDWEKFKNDVQQKLYDFKNESINMENIQEVSNWAKEAWDWAIKNGITDGTRPKETATREEIVTMLYRIMKVK
jgi:N-acetylmuramoyl-L-alanine amidase